MVRINTVSKFNFLKNKSLYNLIRFPSREKVLINAKRKWAWTNGLERIHIIVGLNFLSTIQLKVIRMTFISKGFSE